MIRRIWALLKATIDGYVEDNALSHGAAIAYYTIFALAPVLVIVIAIAGLAFGQEAAEGAISGQIEGLMGHDAAMAIQGMIRSAGNHKSGVIATVIGVLTLLITASGVFGEMQSSLNLIWRADPPTGTVTRLVRARAASLGLASIRFI